MKSSKEDYLGEIKEWENVKGEDDILDIKIDSLIELIRSKPFKKNDVLKLETDLDSFVDSKRSLNDLVTYCRKLKQILDKFDIFGSKKRKKSIEHFYGILESSKHYLDLGYNVLLIESCNSDYLKCFKDIDLVVEKEGLMTFIDYTNHGKEVKNFKIFQESESNFISNKYSVLKTKVNFEANFVVCKIPHKNVPKFEISLPMRKSLEMDEEFTKVDMYNDLFKSFTVGEVKEILFNGLENLKEVKVTKLLRSPSKLKSVYNKILVAENLSKNDSKCAIYMEKILEKLSSSSNKIKDEYSYEFFDQINNNSQRSISYYPLISSSNSHTKDPVKRAAEIIDVIERTHVPSLLWIISLCKDNEYHPTDSEKKDLSYDLEDEYLINHINIRKLSKLNGDGSHSNMFEFKFDKLVRNLSSLAYGKSRKGIIETDFQNKVYNYRKSTYPDLLDYVESEHALKKLSMDFSCYEPRPKNARVLDKLIEGVMDESKLGHLIRSIMRNTIMGITATKGFNWLDSIQSITEAVLSTPKKIIHHEKLNNAGFYKRSVVMHIETLEGRNGLVLCNKVGNNKTPRTACIMGDLDRFDSTGQLVNYHENSTIWFNISPVSLDWNITLMSKVISFCSMEHETILALNPKERLSSGYTENLTMGILMMLCNSSNFSQVSEQVRYLFINCTGISNGCGELIKKISWFKPETLVEKLYCFRMLKMIILLSMLKANQDKTEAIGTFESNLVKDGKTSVLRKKAWKVAFPHESKFVASDQHLYNSFYLCKALCEERRDPVMSQSLVLNKQLNNRIKYLETIKNFSYTSLRNLPEVYEKEDLKNTFRDRLWVKQDNGQWNMCYLTFLLSMAWSLIKVHNPSDGITLIEIIDKNYKVEESLQNMNISDILNTKGSVSDKGKSGLFPIHTVKSEQGGKVKEILVNQTSKCYKTTIQNVSDYMEDTKVERFMEVLPKFNPDEVTSREPNLEIFLNSSSKLLPVNLFNIEKDRPHVARMFAKGQIGPREIGIMNSPMRIACYSIETAARSIKETEYKMGDYTDLIESKLKDRKTTDTYLRHLMMRKAGRKIIFDNADCSKWGPSMMAYALYSTISFRMKDGLLKDMLKYNMIQFSNKRFKIPDNLFKAYLKWNKSGLENSVTTSFSHLLESKLNICNSEHQYIKCCEGMLQGTMNVGSSLIGSDLMRLSCYVNSQMLKEYNYRCEGHVTSDDSSRFESFELNDKIDNTVFKVVTKSLFYHNYLTNKMGIKRNLSKSVLSQYVQELNSVFRSSDGIITPDLKSRLSFVMHSFSQDLYPSALSSISLSAEYLRKEGSIVGSCWIGYLNNYNHLRKSQVLKNFLILGNDIYRIPLEIGGLARINPLKAVYGNKILPILENYGNNAEESLKNIITGKPVDGWIESAGDLLIKNEVPRFSRSRVTRMGFRENRSKRGIREFCEKIEEKRIIEMILIPSGSNLRSLINCFKRESSLPNYLSPSERFEICRAPYESKVYHSNSKFFMVDESPKISRKDMLILSEKWLKSKDRRLNDFDSNLFREVLPIIESEMESLDRVMDRISPIGTVPVINYYTEVVSVKTYILDSTINDHLEKFEKDYLGSIIKGESKSSILDYIEVNNNLSQIYRSFSKRKQKFKLNFRNEEAKDDLILKLLSTNFMEGCRLLHGSGIREGLITHRYKLDNAMKYIKDRNTISRLKNGLGTLKIGYPFRNYPSHIDITELINAFITRDCNGWNSLKDMVTILHSLTNEFKEYQSVRLKNNDSVFLLEPRNLNLPKEGEVIEGKNFKYWTNSYKNDYTGNRSQEVIETFIKNKIKVYKHHITIWSGEVPEFEDNKQDIYSVMDLRGVERLKVSLKVKRSHIWLCIGDHRLFLLSQEFGGTKQTLYLKAKSFDHKHFIKLFSETDATTSEEDFTELTRNNLGIYKKEDVEKDDTKSDLEDISKEANEMGYDGIDFDLDNFDDLMNFSEDLDVGYEEPEEEIKEDVLFESMIDMYHDAEAVNEMNSNTYMTSLFPDHQIDYLYLDRSNFKLMKRREKRKKGLDVSETIYILKLPGKISFKDNYKDEVLVNFDELLEMLESKKKTDELDALWLSSYIKTLIRKDRYFASVMRNMRDDYDDFE